MLLLALALIQLRHLPRHGLAILTRFRPAIRKGFWLFLATHRPLPVELLQQLVERVDKLAIASEQSRFLAATAAMAASVLLATIPILVDLAAAAVAGELHQKAMVTMAATGQLEELPITVSAARLVLVAVEYSTATPAITEMVELAAAMAALERRTAIKDTILAAGLAEPHKN